VCVNDDEARLILIVVAALPQTTLVGDNEGVLALGIVVSSKFPEPDTLVEPEYIAALQDIETVFVPLVSCATVIVPEPTTVPYRNWNLSVLASTCVPLI
jgi:hypothetical protein